MNVGPTIINCAKQQGAFVMYVDQWLRTNGGQGPPDGRYFCWRDGMHLSREGNAFMAKAISNIFRLGGFGVMPPKIEDGMEGHSIVTEADSLLLHGKTNMC